MNTVFAINFRREAYQRELAKTRRRALLLGLWVFYFGALGVVFGLYGLNFVVLAHRVTHVEREVQLLRRHAAQGGEWRPDVAGTRTVLDHLRDARTWRARLARLPELLPANARLHSLQFNPDNASGTAQLQLVIAGEMREGPAAGHVQQVMSFVNALSRDSVFAAGYRNVRLVTTRATNDGAGAEFVIECR